MSSNSKHAAARAGATMGAVYASHVGDLELLASDRGLRLVAFLSQWTDTPPASITPPAALGEETGIRGTATSAAAPKPGRSSEEPNSAFSSITWLAPREGTRPSPTSYGPPPFEALRPGMGEEPGVSAFDSALPGLGEGPGVSASVSPFPPREGGGGVRSRAIIEQTTTELDEYLRGKRTAFTVPLDLAGTPFQIAVWNALLAIPYAATVTYRDLAAAAGRPAAIRAAGAANGANPISIVVPCHRVVGSDASLTGYGGGLPLKRYLIDLERSTSETAGGLHSIENGRSGQAFRAPAAAARRLNS